MGVNMRKSFTLLELLVVFAIFSFLLTLLVPAINKAKDRFKMVGCAGNLRSIGTGLYLYAGDNGNNSMPASFGHTEDGHYNHFINYMISEQNFAPAVFKCSSFEDEDMFDPAGHDPRTGNIYKHASYIMNIIKPGSWSGAVLDNKQHAHGWGLDSVTPISISVVTDPSSKVYILDVIPEISNSHSGVNNFKRSDHGLVKTPPRGWARWVGLPHFSMFNALMGDGGVKSIRRSRGIDWAVNR